MGFLLEAFLKNMGPCDMGDRSWDQMQGSYLTQHWVPSVGTNLKYKTSEKNGEGQGRRQLSLASLLDRKTAPVPVPERIRYKLLTEK